MVTLLQFTGPGPYWQVRGVPDSASPLHGGPETEAGQKLPPSGHRQRYCIVTDMEAMFDEAWTLLLDILGPGRHT